MGEKSFQQRLEEFKEEIIRGYNETTMVKALCEHIREDSREAPTTLDRFERKYDENQHFVHLEGGRRNVKPSNAGFVENLEDWYKNPEGWSMDIRMHELGRTLAENEYAIIVKGIEDCAEMTVDVNQKGQLSVDDIRKAENCVRGSVDSVVMNLQQMREFSIKGQISALSFLPEEKHGYHYSGTIGGLNVFWTNSIKDFALVFSRMEMNFKSTPLEIAFNDIDSPKQLILHKLCVAAPIYDKTVVRIRL